MTNRDFKKAIVWQAWKKSSKFFGPLAHLVHLQPLQVGRAVVAFGLPRLLQVVDHPNVLPLLGEVERRLPLKQIEIKNKDTAMRPLVRPGRRRSNMWLFPNRFIFWDRRPRTLMFCESTLALASSSRLMTVVLPASTAQCSAVFLWYLSPRFTDTLKVSSSRVGSTLPNVRKR